MPGIKFTPTMNLSVSEDDTWELRRALSVYRDWCSEQIVHSSHGQLYPEVYREKIEMAKKMDDRLGEIIYQLTVR
jgi:hypothetical protein